MRNRNFKAYNYTAQDHKSKETPTNEETVDANSMLNRLQSNVFKIKIKFYLVF